MTVRGTVGGCSASYSSTTKLMGLDCLPRSTRREHQQLPDGMVHQEDAPCPFQADGFPVGMLGTCCSLRGKVAAYELDALGEVVTANLLYESVSSDGARRVADEIDAAITRLESRYRHADEKPNGFEWGGILNLENGSVQPRTSPTFDEALAEIRLAARWYRKVADLGFGVYSWY